MRSIRQRPSPALARGRALSGLILVWICVSIVATSVAGASTKFAYDLHVDNTGNLAVTFDERSLKRFEVVEYRLDATAIATWPNSAVLYLPVVDGTLTPDSRGRVGGTLTTTLDLSPPPGGLCGCGLQRVEYTGVTLTNVTTGHLYRLEPVSRTFPSG